MNDRFLLSCLAVGFLAAALVLSFLIDRHALDPDYRKDWWSIAFTDPKDGSLDFIIANHGDRTTFTYTVTRNRQELAQNTVDVPKGTSATIPIDTGISDSRTIIAVWTEEEKDKKEIYK